MKPRKISGRSACRNVAWKDYFRPWLEPLEVRTMLSVSVPWTIDQSASNLAVFFGPQSVTVGATSFNVAVINQDANGDGTGFSWTTNNNAHLSGTIATSFTDNSSIQFLTGQSNMPVVAANTVFPNQAAFVPITGPPNPSPNGNYPGINGGPAVQDYGAYLKATSGVLILTPNIGPFSLANVAFDLTSADLPITAGAFAANGTFGGVSNGAIGMYIVNTALKIGVGGNGIQTPIASTPGQYFPNTSATSATITNTGGANRQLTVPVSVPLVIPTAFGPLTGTATGTIVANATLPSPVIDLNGNVSGTNFTSTWPGGSPVPITDAANAFITDAFGPNLTSMTVALTSPQTGDVLAATTTGSITQSFVNNTLTLSGSDTQEHYQQVLRSITYNNTAAGGPGVASETATIEASDGTNTTNAAVATITINTPPVVDLNGAAGGTGFTSSWTGGPAVNIADATATVTDDGGTLASLKVILNSPHTGDVLAATTTGSITQSFVNNTLTLSGTDTQAHYQQVLRSITYNNTAAGGPGVASETATIEASDGTNTTNAAVATININTPPVVDLNGAAGGTGFTSSWTGGPGGEHRRRHGDGHR